MAQTVPKGAGEFHLPSTNQPFVCGTLNTPVGDVPQVSPDLTWLDRGGHYLMRWNIGRDNFSVEPGLYSLNRPDQKSPVLVTANYKMSFDLLRQTMADTPCWILSLDTKGVNVWCAAGKGSFGTEELVDRIQASRLTEVVRHRRLILPQLGATGVAAFVVKKYSGFSIQYGPVMVSDLPRFLENNCIATPAMRCKNFPFQERLVLVPVEIMLALKQTVPIILLFLLLSGLAGGASFAHNVLNHGLPVTLAILCGVVAGTIATPLLLPWIPGRAFSLKGALCGGLLFAGVFVASGSFNADHSFLEMAAWPLLSLAIASWFGMAFTGASTFTSLNGVRKEMLRAMPLQFIGLCGGVGLWIAALWFS